MQLSKVLTKEVKVGLLTVVAGFMLYFGFNFLKGIDIFSNTKVFYAVFEDTEGLQSSNSVTLSGLTVGQVLSITILQDQGNKVLVTFDVREDIKLHEDGAVMLTDESLLGGKQLKIVPGSSSQYLQDGDTATAKVDVGLMGLVEEKAPPMLDQLDTLLIGVTQLAMKLEAKSAVLDSILTNTNQVTASMARLMQKNERGVEEIMTNFASISNDLEQTTDKLPGVLAKSDQLMDSLKAANIAATVQEARTTMQAINQTMAGINQGEGSLGKLMQDDSLYNKANTTLENLDQLFIDVKENPKRYVHFSVFGRKDKKKK